MSPSEDDRRELYDQLGELLSERNSRTLMESLPPMDWTELATKTDLDLLRREVRADIAGLRGEMAELRADLRAEMVEGFGDIQTRMGSFEHQLSSFEHQMAKQYFNVMVVMIGFAITVWISILGANLVG